MYALKQHFQASVHDEVCRLYRASLLGAGKFDIRQWRSHAAIQSSLRVYLSSSRGIVVSSRGRCRVRNERKVPMDDVLITHAELVATSFSWIILNCRFSSHGGHTPSLNQDIIISFPNPSPSHLLTNRVKIFSELFQIYDPPINTGWMIH